MTPEERAAKIVDGRFEEDFEVGRSAADVLRLEIADAIRAAEDEEREACARIAEGDTGRPDFPWCGDVRVLAAAIRARED
jgi:hypothetical protein